MRILPCLAALLAGLIATMVAHAQTTRVYQWKDAKGVTHYSDNPPPVQATKRNMRSDNQGPAAEPAVARPTENPQCTAAKSNLSILDSSGSVQQDTDGDGKPDTTLDTQGRANQKALAEAAIKAYCKPAGPSPAR